MQDYPWPWESPGGMARVLSGASDSRRSFVVIEATCNAPREVQSAKASLEVGPQFPTDEYPIVIPLLLTPW